MDAEPQKTEYTKSMGIGNIINLIFIGWVYMFMGSPTHGQTQRVLLLGTAHFFNKSDDTVLSPIKQAEITKILSQLKKFHPQQILVEAPPQNDAFYNQILMDHRKGTAPSGENKWLLENEIFQIGIRLAALLNLDRGVQGIDWPDPSPDVISHLENPRERQFHQYVNTLRNDALPYQVMDESHVPLLEGQQRKYARYYTIGKAISLRQMLLTFNSDEATREIYLANRLNHLFLDHQALGAELTGVLTLRDYKIFRNALNAIAPETERVIIIYGAAHIQILKDLFSMDKRHVLVKASTVLR